MFSKLEDIKECIVIGYGSEATKSRSLILNVGPNHFRNNDSNINLMNAAEGNSETGDFRFHGKVTSDVGLQVGDDVLLCLVDDCDACLNLENPKSGILFFDDKGETCGKLCWNCVRDVVMFQKARERWNNEHGDPMINIVNRLKKLEETVKSIKDK